MKMAVKDLNIIASLDYDADAFPLVQIDFDETHHLEVILNDVTICGIHNDEPKEEISCLDDRKISITLFKTEYGVIADIDTYGGYEGEHHRPAVEVVVNGEMVFDMFDEDDFRWEE